MLRIPFLFVSALVGMMFLISVPYLNAQSTFSTVVGTVQDQTGAGIGGATVTLTNKDSKLERTLVSDESGDFIFINIPSGRYTISVEADGFKRSVTTGIEVKTNQTLRLNTALDIGSNAEVINVESSGPIINTENSYNSKARSGSDLRTLPQNFRATNGSIINFFALIPGVILDDNNLGLSINGTRRSQNEISLDGIQVVSPRFNNTIPSFFPSAEIVNEVRIATANSAEFNAVATVITSSRGGGNAFHGGVFEYHQNSTLNARDFFARFKPSLIAHTFGGYASGPIKRDKTFFFADLEVNRITGQAIFNTSVPSNAARAGDFSGLSTPLRNPFTGGNFSGNQIPSNLISPVAVNIQNLLYPLPNQGGTVNLSANGPQKFRYESFDVRIDHSLSADHQIFGRFTFKNSTDEGQAGALPTIGQNNNSDKVRGLTISDTYTFTPSVINEFRFGFSSHEAKFEGPFGGDSIAQLGLQGLFADTTKNGLPAFNIVGLASLSQVATETIEEGTFQITDALTWALGNHTIKFGGDFRRYSTADVPIFSIGGEDFGTFDFDGRFTGNSYGDFLLGLPSRSQRITLPSNYRGNGKEFSFFIQDDYRITPNLTLNLGLRYSYVGPFSLSEGTFTNFDPATGNVIVVDQAALAQTNPVFAASIGNTKIVTADQAGLSKALRRADKNDFAPRIGFAYRPFDNNRTSIRAGFGVYQNRILGRVLHSLTGIHSSSAESFTNSFTNNTPRFQFPNPFPSGFAVGSLQFRTAVDPNLRTPYTMQWNLTVEQELRPNLAVRASYIGSRSNHLIVSPNINQVAPSRLPFSLSRAPYPNFLTVFTRSGIGFQSYHSMQLEVEQRLTKGLSFQTSYTWLRNLSNAGDTDEAGPRIENFFDLTREKGDVTFSRRHRFLTTLIYEAPFGKGRSYLQSGIASHILGGWQVATVLLFQSGRFFTPTFSGSDPSNTNTFGGRADRLADGNLPNDERTIFKWFDPKAFGIPAAGSGRFGNSAPNVLMGPGTRLVNLGLQKILYQRDTLRLTFQATATNVINTANFEVPEANISSSSVGRITRTQRGDAGPRTWQFALRFDF